MGTDILLKNNVFIRSKIFDSIEKRIHLSNGSQLWHYSNECKWLEYDSDAIVPKLPWKSPSIHELKSILTTNDTSHYQYWVGLFACPNDWLISLHQITGKILGLTRSRILQIYQTPDGLKLIQQLTSKINCYYDSCSDISFHKAYVWDAPKLPTTTQNNDSKLLGMHIDAWDWKSKVREENLRWRLSINIGSAERYFLFINLSASQISQVVATRLGYKPKGYKGTQLGRLFMSLFPNYPIVRITVRPFEYYIAPTESIVHDGSKSKESLLDAHLTWRGHFEDKFQAYK